MRIVEQFSQAILAIMQCRKAGDYKEAREQIRITGRHLLRMDIDLLLLYHPDQILDHFTDIAGRLETQKCVLGADLLYELALIEEALQRSEDALRLKVVCIHLYAAALPKDLQFQKSQYFEKVAALKEELKDQSFSEKVLANLHSYDQFHILLNNCVTE
jgi:hypothetical protein